MLIQIKSSTLIRIDTKNWLGNYHSNVVLFHNDNHLSNYLDKIIKSNTSKLIGYSVISPANHSSNLYYRS